MSIQAVTYGLGTALMWSFAVIMFRHVGRDIHPVTFNCLKNVWASLMFALSMLFLHGSLNIQIAGYDLMLLLISGVLGIGLADTLFLAGLAKIGASRMALIECLYAPLMLVFSVWFFQGTITLVHLLGGGLVLSGVVLSSLRRQSVAAEQGAEQGAENASLVLDRSAWVWGITYGVGAVVMIVLGVLMITPILKTYDLMEVCFLRLLAGLVASLALMSFVPGSSRQFFQQMCSRERIPTLITVAFLGTYVTLILWLAGFKFGDSALVAILNQTSTPITVILAGVLLREPITARHWLSTGLSTAGVMLITFASA